MIDCDSTGKIVVSRRGTAFWLLAGILMIGSTIWAIIRFIQLGHFSDPFWKAPSIVSLFLFSVLIALCGVLAVIGLRQWRKGY